MAKIKVEKPPFLFTNRPLLPSNPLLIPGLDTPKTLKRKSWEQSPPICSECGIAYERPRKPRYFCDPACQRQWEMRLSRRPYVPIKFRNKDWPGRDAGELPPEVQLVRDIWNKTLDKGHAIVTCGASRYSFPTNEWPLREDARGKKCERPAGWGTNHQGTGTCRFHGGNSPGSVKKAERLRIEEEMRVREMVYGTPIEQITPDEAILQELARTAGHVQWLYEKMQEVEDEFGENAALKQSTKLGQTPAVWVDLYHRERQHLMQVAKTASSMNISERQIRLAEEQGQLIAQVIRGFMQDPQLGLTPQQMVDAPEVMRRHLAAIPVRTTPTPTAPSIVQANGLTAETNKIVEASARDVDDPED